MKLLNQILSKLPLNGFKSISGAIVTTLYYFFPDYPAQEFGQAGELFSELFGVLGQLYLVLGVIHKYIKAKV